MTNDQKKRLAQLARDYAQAYVGNTDAPEGTQGAWELMALSAYAEAEARGITLFRDDSGKADSQIK